MIYTYENGHSWIVDGYRKEYQVTETVYRWHTYYTTPDAEKEDWEAGKPGDKGDGWENAVDEDAEKEAEENGNNDNSISSAHTLRSSSRPIYPTDQTNVVKTTSLTGQFWHMNWGWGGKYYKNHYAVTGQWAADGDTYRWKRKMLVVTGHK